ncbi:MAG: hypothetical protein ABI210_06655, partial [Abditibacteriaceae bacterium]
TALYEVTAPGGNQNGEVLAVAASAKGVYFGTSVNGTLYRWTTQDGIVELYPSPQKAVYALEQGRDGSLYMATGNSGVVYKMTPGDSTATTRAARILEPTQLQALSLYLLHSNLLVGTGNNGAAYEIPLANAPSGSFTSHVYDSQKKVQWGALRAVQDNANIQTRSGNTSVPDNTWSTWKDVKLLSTGEMQVDSPNSRYIQYKVLLNGNANPPSEFARIAISYRAENQPPQVAITAPQNGAYWNDKKSITWTGTDPDEDTLTYTLSLLGPDHKWKDVSDKPLMESPFSLDTTKWSDGSYQLKIIASDELSNPLDPKKSMVQTLPFIIDNTPPVIAHTRIQNQKGQRYIKADVSDATSPVVGVEWRIASDSKETKKESASVPTSDKKADLNSKATNSRTIQTGDKVTSTQVGEIDTTTGSNDDTDTSDTTGAADTADTDITSDAKLDVDGWHAMAAADGLFDSRQEAVIGILQFTPDEIKKQKGKPFQIELRAHDAAGNIIKSIIEVPIS